MKLSFLPREEKFFTLFHESAANVKETAVKLLDLMENYENVPEKVAEIKRLEEVGDTVIHTIMTSLHRTFVTPLDREDIAALGERLDDIVDSMEEAARLMMEYHIQESTENAKALARILLRCSETLEQAIGLLHLRGAKLRDILPLATVINTLENEADQVVSRAMADLFDDDASPIYVIKWKEIYDLLEGATDHCETAANMLEGIVLKHA